MATQVTVDLKGRHLVLGLPAYDGTFPDELMSAVIETISLCRRHGVNVTVASRCGSALIDKTRDEIVHAFLHTTDGTDLLFIDSDVVWHPDDVLRLLAWGTTRDFVCGPYCVKQDDPAFYYDLLPSPEGKIIQDPDGLIELKSAPGGFNLISRHALETMVAEHPELQYVAHRGEFKGKTVSALSMMYLRENDDGTRSRIGEDIAFSNRYRATGMRMWLDPTIELGHIGKKIYRASYTDWVLSRQQPKVEEAA